MTWTYKLVFPNYVNENEISVVRKNPDTINFTVIKNGSKTVDIKGSFEGTIAEGCVAEEFVFDPKTLTIDGPEEIINKIDHVWVKFGKNHGDPADTQNQRVAAQCAIYIRRRHNRKRL